MYFAIIGDIIASKTISNRSEVQNHLKRILDQVNEEFIAWVGESRKELNHYYVLPSGCADTGAFMKRVLSESGRNRVYLTEKECGVCGSGFFTSRVLK